MSGKFHVNLGFSGLVVLEKIFTWSHHVCIFCDFLPFDEDLVLYLNELEFPSSKDNLHQV
jgi:hypothetical protein